MLKSLPPVGNPIVLTPAVESEKIFEACFRDRSVFLYGSGTMALAASLVAVKEHSNIAEPEVLLPAYACPDLVSAILFAELNPVLVDLQPDTPWMDLSELQRKIGPNTIAVIATHFLGIPERLADIRSVVEGTDVLIIEDSAQLFPVRPTSGVWEGDLVILSFGRGKPISLLGGGAVLCQRDSLIENLPMAEASKQRFDKIKPRQQAMLFKTKIQLYNILLAPWAYGLLKLLPFLKLGETIYEPLEKICPFEKDKVGMLAANIKVYCTTKRPQQDCLSAMLKKIECDEISDLTTISKGSAALPLLRYPILVKNEGLRDRLFNKMTKAGLGCSVMYPHHLPEIEGIEDVFHIQGKFPQARLLSQRLLTLPCHSGVVNENIDLMKYILKKYSKE